MRRFLFGLLVVALLPIAAYSQSTSTNPCNYTVAGSTYCTPTPLPIGTNPNGYLLGTTYSMPTGSAISGQTFQSDQLVDSIGMNVPLCTSTTAFSSSPSPTDTMSLAYTRVDGIRHVREGFGNCNNNAAHDAWWAVTCQQDHVDAVIGQWTYQLPTYYQQIFNNAPCVRAFEFTPNEYDSYINDNTGASLKLFVATAVGATQISIGFQTAAKAFIRGQQYFFADATNEQFTASLTQTDLSNMNVVGAGGGGLLQAHAINTPVKRVCADFVCPVVAWYQNEATLISRYTTLPILAPNMAQPIHSYGFFNDGVSLGQLGATILDSHPYPASNPEALLGDWGKSFTGISHGGCSGPNGNSSYSFNWNTCAGRYEMGYPYENAPVWITEYAYQVGPVAAATPASSTSIIPDDVAADYQGAEYIGLLSHGVSRMYQFQIEDGTSGVNSGFTCYGHIRNSICEPSYGAGAAPKTEFIALMSLATFYNDPSCNYTNGCRFTAIAPNATWSSPALPLNAYYHQMSNGTMIVAYWNGLAGYTIGCTGTLAATSACYTTPSAISETFTSPYLSGLANVTGYTLDDGGSGSRSNGTPPPATLQTALDGSTSTLPKCAAPSVTPYAGCIDAATAIPVSGTSVSVSATRAIHFLVFQPQNVATPVPYVVPTFTPPSPIPT